MRFRGCWRFRVEVKGSTAARVWRGLHQHPIVAVHMSSWVRHSSSFPFLLSAVYKWDMESKHALSSEEEVLAFGAQQRSELETRVTDYD